MPLFIRELMFWAAVLVGAVAAWCVAAAVAPLIPNKERPRRKEEASK